VDPGLVLEHEPDAPAALLERWAGARGIPLEIVQAGAADPAAVEGRPFLVTLGSEASAYDDGVPWIATERSVLARALDAGVPVLGICFGAQHLARALGGEVGPAARSEVGWMEVETLAPGIVPAGPWLQWHHDAFTPPPGAELLARSPVCAQAFRLGPHLGVQFHPEVTPKVVRDWATSYPASLERAGTTAAAVLEDTERLAAAAERAAFALFDAFVASSADERRMPSPVLG
jgi:GMP synthase (glutamine-hydrolysing)